MTKGPPQDVEIVSRPQWPTGRRSAAPRVLVEHPEPLARSLIAEKLRDRGYQVVECGGPTAHGSQQIRACPLLTGGQCSAVASADVVISSLRLSSPEEGLIVRRIAEDHSGPALVLEATNWQVEQAFGQSGAVPHEYPLRSVKQIIGAIEGLGFSPKE